MKKSISKILLVLFIILANSCTFPNELLLSVTSADHLVDNEDSEHLLGEPPPENSHQW